MTSPARLYLLFLSNFAALGTYFIPLFLAITWSIAIEEQFYVVWPQLFAFTPRRMVKLICPLVIIASLVFRVVHRNLPLVLSVHSLSVMSDLAMGGLVAFLSLNSSRFLRICENMNVGHVVLGYALGMTAVLFRNYVYYPTDSVALMRVESLLVILRRLILSVFFAFVIIEQNWARGSPLKLSKLSLVSAMGKCLRALPVAPDGLAPCRRFPESVTGDRPRTSSDSDLRSARASAERGGTSVASYHAYEMPFLNLKKRFAHVASGLS